MADNRITLVRTCTAYANAAEDMRRCESEMKSFQTEEAAEDLRPNYQCDVEVELEEGANAGQRRLVLFTALCRGRAKR